MISSVYTTKKLLIIIFLLFSAVAVAQENCDNGIDDDGDGKIDLNDIDCVCSTSTVPSIIPNPSFEEIDSCPNGISQLVAASAWEQATSPTTDYFNTCGYVNDANLTPFPDGNAAVGAFFVPGWQEYLGACLTGPMLAGTNYQLSFYIASKPANGDVSVANGGVINYGPVNVTLFGRPTCTGFPIMTNGCPSDWDTSWVVLGSATYTPVGHWGILSINFTPSVEINSVILGSPCVLPADYNSGEYFYFDNLILNTAASFGVNVISAGNFCDNDLVLSAVLTTPMSPAVTYQWYHNGIAIAGAVGSNYNVPSFAANLGDYCVKITDAGICYVSMKITVNNTIPSPDYTVVQPNCIVTTGSITITTPGAEYSFNNGATWQTSPTMSGINLGTYFIKIKTPSGCISSATGVAIVQPQLLSGANCTVVQPTTCSDTGSITIISSVALQFSFDGGTTWGSSNTMANLAPGTYQIKIKDNAGCESGTQYAYINQVFTPSPAYTVTQPTCGVDGTITITTTANEYSFNNGDTWTTIPTATGLLPGYYSLLIRDSAGCESYSQYVYIYAFQLEVTPTYTSIPPTCGTGGTITITTAAAQYSFDNGATWGVNPTATNLPAGYYLIKIMNSLGCVSYSQYIYLNYTYLPNPAYSIVQPSCGTGGSITINDATATEYSFDGGSTWSTNATASNLPPGSYRIMIRDAAGCMSDDQYVSLYYYYLPDPLYVAVNPGCGDPGSITITTPGMEYSFDGGSTWSTDPVATNLSAGYYIIKIRNSLGCQSLYEYVYLYNTYINSPDFTIVQPTCDAGGTITISTTAAFYSIDGGTTWSTSNIFSNLVPAAYQIQIKDAIGCTSAIANAYLYQPYLPSPAYSTTHPFCTETTGIITITPVSGGEYSFNNGITWQFSNISGPLPSGYYQIKVRNILGCESPTIYVTINPASGIPIAPPAAASQLYCIFNNPTIDFLNATGQNIEWYTSQTSTIPLAATTPLIDGMTYFASQTVNSCQSPVRTPVSVTLSNFVIPSVDYSTLICDDGNNLTENVNLTDYNSNLISVTTGYTFTYYHSLIGAETAMASDQINNSITYPLSLGANNIYVRLVYTNGCYRVSALTLDLIPSPLVVMDDSYIVCENHTVQIHAGLGFDSYLWSSGETTPSIIVDAAGNFSVTVTENHGTLVCSSIKNFVVKPSNPATITTVNTTDWTDVNNSITVLLSNSSIGWYEYSLDGINYQESNSFVGLLPGDYTVYVRDKNGCGMVQGEVFLLMYPKFFTPNDDLFNDFWKIKFSELEPGLTVDIFNREGKFIKHLDYDMAWDGLYNGRMLPSTDYWFVVTRANGKQYRGHFTLKR